MPEETEMSHITMDRITVEMGLKAYADTGAIPTQGWYYKPPQYCRLGRPEVCGLGAVILAGLIQKVRMDEDRNLLADRVLGKEYRIGFVHGFDSKPKNRIHPEIEIKNEERYELGYSDGQALWAAVSKHKEREKVTAVA